MGTKTQYRLGDHAYEVEWCTNLPVDEFGDSDLDAAEYVHVICPTRKAADAKAREVYPQDQFGAVRITEVELVDPYGERIRRTYVWEAIGHSDHYEGEDRGAAAET